MEPPQHSPPQHSPSQHTPSEHARSQHAPSGHPAAPVPEPTHLSLREPAHQVDPRAKTLWRLGPLIVCLPLLIAAIAVAALVPVLRWEATAAAVVVALGTLFLVTVVPVWRYRFHRWETSEDAVYTRSGWLTRSSVIIPIARIQVVDTEAGPLDQLLGLATLTVTTASSAGTVRIVGLDAEVARRVAADLTIRTQAHTGDAT